MNSDTGESSNDGYASNPTLSNSVQGNNGLDLSQFASLSGTACAQNMINFSHLQSFARQQQQQREQQQPPNLFRSSLAASIPQNQTAPRAFSYYQQAHQALHEPDPIRQTSSSKNEKALSDRSKFVVFVKVLLRYMDKLSDSKLTQRTKHVIAECTRLHRNGALGYTSLSDALEFRLRSVIGDDHWNRAQNYCTYLMERKERGPGEKMVSSV